MLHGLGDCDDDDDDDDNGDVYSRRLRHRRHHFRHFQIRWDSNHTVPGVLEPEKELFKVVTTTSLAN